MPFIGAGVGAGVGLGKYFLVDQPQYRREKKLAAETARYSPWTGLRPQVPKQPSWFDNTLKYGTTGASFGQNVAGTSPLAANGMGQMPSSEDYTMDNMAAGSPWAGMRRRPTLFGG